MKKLISGLRAYMQTVHGQEQELFDRLAQGQAPEVFLVTCSDSRIVPHLITQSLPGDLFVVRNAGNLVPAHGSAAGGEVATLEYALEVLATRDVVVCGHSDCGAMKGLLNPSIGEALPTVASWLEHAAPVRRLLAQRDDFADERARVRAATEINVLVQLQNLLSHPMVSKRVEAGKVHLHGWIYDIGSGEVRAFDASAGRFVSLRDRAPAPVRGTSTGLAESLS